MKEIPLRVDFAGGWLDVPSFSRKDGIICNCAIFPTISKHNCPYHIGGGLGGSAANSILKGENSILSEINNGVGWQDPAIIIETGLCAWQSGTKPKLIIKRDGSILIGKMAINWTGKRHYTSKLVNNIRDYNIIVDSGKICYSGILKNNLKIICNGIKKYYESQLKEGMTPLVSYNALAYKYCGSGWGGYSLYIFNNTNERNNFVINNKTAMSIEPYCRWLK